MSGTFNRRVRALELAAVATPQFRAFDLSLLTPDDRVFFDEMMRHRLAGGSFNTDADRERYHDLLLDVDPPRLATPGVEARG